MPPSAMTTPVRSRVRIWQRLNVGCNTHRLQSSASSHGIVSVAGTKGELNDGLGAPVASSTSPLARLSTSSILRSLFLSTFFTSPLLFKPGFAVFRKIANSESIWLNPDRNPLLRAMIRPIVYDQFCAGTNKAEIQQTASEIKRLGFSGVVLCYGREVQVAPDNKYLGYDDSKSAAMDAEINLWRDENLKTLDMVEAGDWLGIKYTGAGLHITDALINGESAPPKFTEAMVAICERAAARGCRIWIDAEQQVLQATIDKWTFGFMSRFNSTTRSKNALIYNTIQAYLKSSRDKVQHQLDLAHKEGWRPAIKLVRGAYISNDMRSKIHDTKADTDASYNGIVNDLLCGNFPALVRDPTQQFDLLLAGHNSESIRRAARLASELMATSKLRVVPDFAQLQGMADDIGCELLRISDDAKAGNTGLLPTANAFSPKVYKCLTWGSMQDCMQYLTRRLVENRGAADRMREGVVEFKKELRRRFVGV